MALPNFGDELGVVNALQFAKLGVPVLVQDSDDALDKLDTAHRRDSFCGKISICRVPGLQKLLEHICKAGFEHHCAMARSHCADIVAEAVTTYLGWDLHAHERSA